MNDYFDLLFGGQVRIFGQGVVKAEEGGKEVFFGDAEIGTVSFFH